MDPPSSHPLQVIKGRPFKSNLLAVFNFLVVLFSIQCSFSGFYFVAISNIDFLSIPFIAHGFRYMHLFFSLWGSVVQSIYFWVILGIDVIDIFKNDDLKWIKWGNQLKKIAPYLFYTAVFPISVSVGMMFWGMYFIDRELIYPSVLDEVYPRWVNHAMHTIPVILVLVYLLIEREREVPMRHTLSGMTGILVFYATCIFYVKFRDDKWMYYGLHLLPPTTVNYLLFVGTVSCLYMTVLGHTLTALLNRLHSFNQVTV